MNIFNKLDDMLGYSFFNPGRKVIKVQRVCPLPDETPPKIGTDSVTILIWLQKQIEWETGLRLDTVFDKVTNAFHPIDLHTIHDLSLTDDLAMDSFELTHLLLETENHFNIEINNEAAVKVRTVGDALILISKTLQETNNKMTQGE